MPTDWIPPLPRYVGFAGGGSLSVVILARHSTVAAFTSAGQLGVEAKLKVGEVAFGGDGSLGLLVSARHSTTVGFTGGGAFAAIAAASELVAVSGSGGLVIDVFQRYTVAVAFTGAGNVGLAALARQTTDVAFTGEGSVAVPTGALKSAAYFSGEGRMNVIAVQRYTTTVAFTGGGTMAGTARPVAGIPFTSAGALAVTAVNPSFSAQRMNKSGNGVGFDARAPITGWISDATQIATVQGNQYLRVVGDSTNATVVAAVQFTFGFGPTPTGSIYLMRNGVQIGTATYSGTSTPTITLTGQTLADGDLLHIEGAGQFGGYLTMQAAGTYLRITPP